MTVTITLVVMASIVCGIKPPDYIEFHKHHNDKDYECYATGQEEIEMIEENNIRTYFVKP